MKRLRYILMIVLSLLVIYSGVGISVCSCYMCEVACIVCSTPCSACEHDEEESDTGCSDSSVTCEEEGCSINIYKVNLAQESIQVPLLIPSFELFCGLLPVFQSLLPVGEAAVQPYASSPPLMMGSRHYLALYSVLVI